MKGVAVRSVIIAAIFTSMPLFAAWVPTIHHEPLLDFALKNPNAYKYLNSPDTVTIYKKSNIEQPEGSYVEYWLDADSKVCELKVYHCLPLSQAN